MIKHTLYCTYHVAGYGGGDTGWDDQPQNSYGSGFNSDRGRGGRGNNNIIFFIYFRNLMKT